MCICEPKKSLNISKTRVDMELEWKPEKPEYQESNRTKKLSPKLGKFFCDNCDGNLVGKGSKCCRCGFKQMKRKLKK